MTKFAPAPGEITKKKNERPVMACLSVKPSSFTPNRRLLSCSTPWCGYHHNLWLCLFASLSRCLAWRPDRGSTLGTPQDISDEPPNAQKGQCYNRSVFFLKKGCLDPVLSVSFCRREHAVSKRQDRPRRDCQQDGHNWQDILPKVMLTGVRSPPTAAWVIKDNI